MKWLIKLNNDIRIISQEQNPTSQQIADYCDLFIAKLKRLEIDAGRYDKLKDLIEENIDHFNFCKEFANGEIPKSEYSDYGFDGNLKDLFDDYVKEFWDICDYQIDIGKKFCFIDF
jgi:hypothetical protein